MIQGARQLPTKHVSVRVPWHDGRWSGHVCGNPKGNTSCLILNRIAGNRDDAWETEAAGTVFDEEGTSLPPCADERGAFMSETAYSRRTNHPYRHNDLYQHFRETLFQHPPKSAAAVPFNWMIKSKDDVPEPAKRYQIELRPDWEPDLSFSTTWVQERRNQLAMLDTFFGAITPGVSLVFFYAKRTPLTDDPRRVIVGIGRVLGVADPVEYRYADDAPKDAMRCVLWERTLRHSIKPEIGDGFLLPYHDLIELADGDAELDLSQYVLHAPEEHWDAFSMGSEHVSHDQAISVLLSACAVIDRYSEILPGDWAAARRWVDEQLNLLWRFRGAFPGLGSALSAFGIENGTLVAHAIGSLLHADGSDEVRDPWPLVNQVIRDPKQLQPELTKSIGTTIAKLWSGLPDERRALLQLLARFELTAEQARRWFVREERQGAGIEATDVQILSNPYLLYELDREQLDGVSLKVVDRGLFAEANVLAAVPVPLPSACVEVIDPRRGRALMVQALERATGAGHTLLPQDMLVGQVREEIVSPACLINGDWVAAFQSGFAPELEPAEMQDGAPAWQLERYAGTRALISARVRRRLTGARHVGQHDWRALIDETLSHVPVMLDKTKDELARVEKAAALRELFESRLSVFIGPAGTGKTSLLNALISMPEVARGGVLLLAPTGKARVQMQRRSENAEAYTLAQFLLKSNRYNGGTGAYRVTNLPPRENGYETVVIDEASMLTEDQFAATLDALELGKVGRLILVGDPRQLPPIGAGRPFVDIIRLLRENAGQGPVSGFAELRVVCRQGHDASEGAPPRDDVLLSRWFGGDAPDAGADEVWQRLADNTANGVKVVRWNNDMDLQAKLLVELEALVRRLAPDEALDLEGAFGVSLGGSPYEGQVYYSPAGGRGRGAGEFAEAWQILSPVRAGETGVDGLNRWIQKRFRKQSRKWAEPENPWHRKTAKPMGAQGILYGDKVINLQNGNRRDVYPELERAYLANGEIGMVVGQYKGRNARYKGLPWQLEVEFSTQPRYAFKFNARDFGEDGNDRLELAYALTVHKSQGSEFGSTLIVVPNPCRPLSRELLYTALTRQRDDVVLLIQGEPRELMKYSQVERSDTARRLTNLFENPKFVAYAGTFLEEGLIHRTARGEMVRSKSEVIVADILQSLGLEYAYEQPFRGTDGSTRFPDFVVDDAESGRFVIIEHLGMLDLPDYRRRWERKLAWYREQGVLPVAEGRGPRGMLVTTTEGPGLDVPAIRAAIASAFGL
ncbi:MAG: AAA family ATPase [Parvibaculaceae bacterium]